jgi:hypothetical protein
LQFRIVWENQDEKFWYTCVVSYFHITGLSAGKRAK